MSIRSHRHREAKIPPTDPKWYPTTRGLNRWLNRLADRRDLTVRVLRGNIGAPARYVPNVAEIDFSESMLARIDPRIAGSSEFVIKHPAIAGAAVHEASHARYSTFDLPSIADQYGPRHTQTLAMLEEARCETQNWPNLGEVEQAALQSMVLSIVLKDSLPEDGSEPDFSDPHLLIRLVGLLAGRVATGIVDLTNPKAARLWNHVQEALDGHFDTFNDLAVRFSKISTSYYWGDNYVEEMHVIVQEWLDYLDSITPEPGEGEDGESEDGEGEGEGEGEGSGSGSGESSSAQSGKPDGESDDESAAGGSDDGESDEGDDDEQGQGPGVGDDDEGEVGDGSETLEETQGDPSLGQYASGNIDAGALAEIFEEIAEAAEEAEHVSGSRLRRQSIVLTRATAGDHQRRRALNKEASKRWR